uniref:Pentatricopeptide repeat-containing protein n=1 Tax=Ananas comosus var. bracteatus TaxID=296719 RepID=A0A6V7Q6G9_ANACO|nr:unnamed protein product [Ananas comosus var. bracteatus]
MHPSLVCYRDKLHRSLRPLLFPPLVRRNVAATSCGTKPFTTHEAVGLFLRAHRSDVSPLDDSTLSSILRLCGALSDVVFGKQLHSLCVKYDQDKALSVGTSLLGMYAKCHSIEDAAKVFDRMPERNAVAWTTLITGVPNAGPVNPCRNSSFGCEWKDFGPTRSPSPVFLQLPRPTERLSKGGGCTAS